MAELPRRPGNRHKHRREIRATDLRNLPDPGGRPNLKLAGETVLARCPRLARSATARPMNLMVGSPETFGLKLGRNRLIQVLAGAGIVVVIRQYVLRLRERDSCER